MLPFTAVHGPNSTDPVRDTLYDNIVTSEIHPEVTYELRNILAIGGMATVYFALRCSPDGAAPAVVKVMHPQFGSDAGSAGHTALIKEVVALGRLDEQLPRTPFVVRLLDVGTTTESLGSRSWLALEHVFGGLEGTTLEERVAYSVKNTGHAFDSERTGSLVRALSEGLRAIHDVGIIHRDIKPANVLCCGIGIGELFKIADFGIARSIGMDATFGHVGMGTPGYAPPEQLFPDSGDVGTWSDVFAVAATIFHVLTGEDYFNAGSPAQALMVVRGEQRRELQSCRHLTPELRENIEICAAIDRTLQLATCAEKVHRLQSVDLLTGSLEVLLERLPPSAADPYANTRTYIELDRVKKTGDANWTVRHPPGDNRVVHRVAWSEDGTALAATGTGLDYWNGTAWTTLATTAAGARAQAICVVKPGVWLLAGAEGEATLYSTGGSETALLPCPQKLPFTQCSGDPGDLALFAAEPSGAPPLLVAMAAGRWMKPCPIPGAATINDLCRLEDQRWLVCGRTDSNAGFAAIYEPLQSELNHIVQATQPLLSCGGDGVGEWAVIGGKAGETYRLKNRRIDQAAATAKANLTCTTVDRLGRAWAGSAGRIFESSETTAGRWAVAWENAEWHAPFRSLHSEVGLLYAMTVDGGVLEGRSNGLG